ncbi:ribosome hibernation promotion factor [Methylopila jiangsuensis]|uniref:Ribosome hibernation promoting factor n=1 Tax=Methylopila jiangsuensis TaxID=586230 RepID=A0A9W6JK57_9HYPH|nr:ribosome-associated translation inhibitor RaiA [Methylopila jiangsuensis]MDR6286640.1 ribosomal subunit interface protein [Methylopila jiangsuensis]GLK77018.1 ribosome hibernation promotion factor [Methylopila jiangsuensis]
MSLRVSGKNLDIGEALRGQVQDRISDAMTKYFGGGFSGHVTVAKDGAGFRTECSLHLDSGIVLQSAGAAADAYASFDQAADRIETRLRRYKQRLRDHHADAQSESDLAPYVVFESPDDASEVEEEGWSPVIVAETTTKLRRMTVGFAVMELDLTGAPVVVFRHAVHGRINMVYRRADGNVGWIDPQPGNGAADGH